MAFISRKIQEKSTPFLRENSFKMPRSRIFFGPEIVSFSQKKFLFSKNLFLWLILSSLILIYLFLGIKNIFSPPEIIVYLPPDNLVTQEKTVVIKGKVKGEAIVSINNQPIALKGNVFEEKITLSPGVNLIKISGRKKYSPERVIFRRIVVK